MLNLVLASLLLAVQPANGDDPAADEAVQTTSEGQAQEEEICRVRRVPSERVGERFRRQRVCMTRSEWDEQNRRR